MSRWKQSLMGNLPSGGSWRLVSSVYGLEAVEGAFANAQTSRDPIGWASLGQGVVLRRNAQPKRKDTCKPFCRHCSLLRNAKGMDSYSLKPLLGLLCASTAPRRRRHQLSLTVRPRNVPESLPSPASPGSASLSFFPPISLCAFLGRR